MLVHDHAVAAVPASLIVIPDSNGSVTVKTSGRVPVGENTLTPPGL
jgi:hypothetical protein